MMTLITSPGNPRISKLRDLHTARGRKKSGLFLMEGIHLLEALLDAGIVPQEVYYQAEVLQHSAKGRALLLALCMIRLSRTWGLSRSTSESCRRWETFKRRRAW